MGKFFIRTCFIIFSGLAFYFGMLWFATAKGMDQWLPNYHSTCGGYGQLLLRIREAQQVENVDMLFIGSSHAYRGFDPREFEKQGISSFNLGSSSQTPYNSYYLLKEYLPAINPKVIIMDLYWNMLVQDGLESTIDIVSNAEHSGEVFEMVMNSKDGIAFNSMLVNTVRRLHKPLDRQKQEESETDVYVKGGFTESLHTENTLTEEELEALAPMEFNFAEVQKSHLKKIIRMCRERDIQLVFVVTPVTEYYSSKLANYAEYKATISELAAHHNIPLLDYNGRSDLVLDNLKEFYDEDHLTQVGVRKFNRVLLKDLQDRQIIKQLHTKDLRMSANSNFPTALNY